MSRIVIWYFQKVLPNANTNTLGKVTKIQTLIRFTDTFYRMMLRSRARLCHSMSVCLSVRPSVTFRYCDHTGWNYSKIISRPNSLRLMCGLTQQGRSCAMGTPLNLGWNRGRVTQEHKKPSISPKWCKIGSRLLWRTNRKSHMCFRLVPKSMALDDLEWRIQGLPKVFKYLLLSQERVKLRTSNLADTFTGSIRTKAH